MMDDGELWELERQGAPVSHCRAKLGHDREARIERQVDDARRALRKRLSPRWAA